MSRFSIATLCLLVVGLVPPLARAGSNDVGVTDGQSAAPSVLNDSEKIGREVQRELARLGCFSGNVEEGWGREGRAAVKRLNQAAQIAWPDWPTADLVGSLRTYADGYCQKCRGDACATASVEPEKSPVTTVAKPPVAAKTEKPAAPVAMPVPQPPATAPVVAHEPVNAPAESHVAKTESRQVPETNTGNDVKLHKEEEDHISSVPLPTKRPVFPVVDNVATSQRKPPVPTEQVVSILPAAAPIPEPTPAPPPPPQHSRGSAWANSGPNLDGR